MKKVSQFFKTRKVGLIKLCIVLAIFESLALICKYEAVIPIWFQIASIIVLVVGSILWLFVELLLESY